MSAQHVQYDYNGNRVYPRESSLHRENNRENNHENPRRRARLVHDSSEHSSEMFYHKRRNHGGSAIPHLPRLQETLRHKKEVLMIIS